MIELLADHSLLMLLLRLLGPDHGAPSSIDPAHYSAHRLNLSLCPASANGGGKVGFL